MLAENGVTMGTIESSDLRSGSRDCSGVATGDSGSLIACLQRGHTSQSFPNSSTNWGLSSQTYGPLGTIPIQTTTGDKPLAGGSKASERDGSGGVSSKEESWPCRGPLSHVLC